MLPALALAHPFLSSTRQGDDIHKHFTELESPGRDGLHCVQSALDFKVTLHLNVTKPFQSFQVTDVQLIN